MSKSKSVEGRPSSYDPVYCDKILEYFDQPLTVKKKVKKIVKGIPFEEEIEEPTNLPTLYGFARSIGVCKKTINNWCDNHEEFLRAVNKAKAMMADNLINNGLLNRYNNRIVQLLLASQLDIRETNESDSDKNVTVIVNGNKS